MTARDGLRPRDERPDPRTFCRDRFPWPFVVDLSDGNEVTACYLVHEKQRRETRASKPFLSLLLGDRTGTIEAVIWDDADRWEPLCAPEEIIGVRGRVSIYREKLQLKVEQIEPLRLDDGDLDFFLPASPRHRKAMEGELKALIDSVADGPLQTLLHRCLGRETALGQAFRNHPAAKKNHHAYIGGLLEHSLSVAHIADRLAGHYASCGVQLDRDLLVAGALLHDIGKLRELKGSGSFDYTTEGRLLGHVVIGIQMVGRMAEEIDDFHPDRLLLLQHLIASHQGRPEWESAKVPQMLEALLLHYADDLDSKMNPAMLLLAGVEEGRWSEYNRNLARSFFQPPALSAAPEIEAVPADEAVELLIDLFRR